MTQKDQMACSGCGEIVYLDWADGWRNDNGLTKIDARGKIHLPEDLKLPLSPKRAHQLGVALIGGAHLSREWKRESQ